MLTQHSIAFHVARLAQEQGATVILTSFGRQMKLTQAIAKRLPEPAPVLTLDVTNREDLDTLKDRVLEHVDGLDGVVHSIGFAPSPSWVATSSRGMGRRCDGSGNLSFFVEIPGRCHSTPHVHWWFCGGIDVRREVRVAGV